jgi:TPR repeat protein
MSTKKEDGLELTQQQIEMARENDGDTLFTIGDMYYTNKDNTKALAWYYKAALQNCDRAQLQIGDMYEKGHGVSVDYKQAMKWFLKAAKNKNTDAMNNIGYLYRNGLGVSRSVRTALEWNTMAANQHYEKSQINAGPDHHQVEDIQKIVSWYQKAADNGVLDKTKKQAKRSSKQVYDTNEEQQGNCACCTHE